MGRILEVADEETLDEYVVRLVRFAGDRFSKDRGTWEETDLVRFVAARDDASADEVRAAVARLIVAGKLRVKDPGHGQPVHDEPGDPGKPSEPDGG